MKHWNCCKTNPPEEGKKVLCRIGGDFYVAYRMKDYYIPMPFVTHVFAKRLCKAEEWQEIDFPKKYHGKLYIMEKTEGEAFTLAELKHENPKLYNDLCDRMIDSIGNEESDKKLRDTFQK